MYMAVTISGALVIAPVLSEPIPHMRETLHISGRVLEDNTVEWFDGSHFYKRVATYESEFVGQESGAVLDGYVRRMEQKTDNGQRMYKWDVHGVVTFPDGTFRKYHSVFHAILDENNTLKQYIDHYNWAG